MHDVLAQLFGYLRGAWRYRWVGLFVSWLLAISGWVYVAHVPDEYKGTARVFVDTNSVLRPLLQGLTVQPDLVQRVALMSRMVLNRPNLEKIMSMSDLDLASGTEREKEQLLTDLGEDIRLDGDRTNASLYTLSFQHRNPATARKVLQSLVSIFIDEALVGDQRSTATAQDFLDKEIGEYESRLKEKEKQLADFKREYTGLLPGEQQGQGGYYAALETAKTELKDAELALREANWRHDELSYQMETQDQAFISSVAEETSPQTVDPRIIAMQTKLDDLLLRFTEKHPDVMQLKRQIEESRARNRQQAIASRGAQATGDVQAGTVYGSLRVALSEADAQVAALKARVEDYSHRVAALETQINSIPTIEAKLKQLTRDYATVSEQHKELLQRRESARLSTQVEQTTEGVKFRVVDPPFVPLKPSAPNRIALSSAVLLVAIGAGLAAALAMDLLQPVFDDRRLLYQVTGLPVLGTVALVRPHADRRKDRMKLAAFVAMCAGLVFALVFVIAGLPVLRTLI